MAHQIENRVLETTTTTGTGNITLAGAVTGYTSFGGVVAVGDTFDYYIEAVDGSGNASGDYEVGRGTYSATNTLTRTRVESSTNSNSLVSFSAGTKRVGLIVSANSVTTIGRVLARVLGIY